MLKTIKKIIPTLIALIIVFGLANNASAATTNLGSYRVNTIGNWYSSSVKATGTSMTMSVTVTNKGGRADLQVKSGSTWKDVDNWPVELTAKKTYTKKYTVKKGSTYRIKVSPSLFVGAGTAKIIQ